MASDTAAILPLAGMTALVTGSTSGIGRAIALQFAQDGADVVVHGRQQSAARDVVGGVARLGRASTAILADLADARQRIQLMDEAWQWRSGVDIWVNNAGADVLTGEAAHWSFEQKLAALWRVDVEATIDLSRCIGQRMFERATGKSVILNIGWDQAEQGMAGDSGQMFGAVKGAIMAFSRSLAQSLAPHVRVNCLCPGWIRTAWGENASTYWQERATRQALRSRWGTAEDVAQAAIFLASPAADFITGQMIHVNGGYRYE